MTPTQLETLKQEILQDPQTRGYVVLLPDRPGILVERLNDVTAGSGTVNQTRMIGIGTVLDALGPEAGAQVLNAVEALKNTNMVVKWAWYLLEQGNLDVGLASTQQQLDVLAQANAMTQQQADILKNLGKRPASRAEVLFGQPVTEADVRAALEV
jgi:hypothetical protein